MSSLYSNVITKCSSVKSVTGKVETEAGNLAVSFVFTLTGGYDVP